MQLNAKDVTRQAITLEPNRTLYDSRNSLLRYNISRVIVAKDNKPLGIATERDISRFLYREVPNRRLNEIRLDEIMSKNLVVEITREEDDLKTCAKLMLENKISSIIVIDNNNGLKGIFTKSDVVDAYAKYYPRKSLVDEYMTKKVIAGSATRCNEMRFGTKMIILPTKLMSSTPGYPKVLRSAKIS